MLNPDEQLQSQSGVGDVDIPCSNCGHAYSHHLTLYGVTIPCDSEVCSRLKDLEAYWEDVPCGCLDYQPVSRETILQDEGAI